MPQAEGYVSLESNGIRSVYNATTEPQNGGGHGGATGAGKISVLESVKRAIGQAIGSPNTPLSSSANGGGEGGIGFISGSNQDTASLLFSSGGALR